MQNFLALFLMNEVFISINELDLFQDSNGFDTRLVEKYQWETWMWRMGAFSSEARAMIYKPCSEYY